MLNERSYIFIIHLNAKCGSSDDFHYEWHQMWIGVVTSLSVCWRYKSLRACVGSIGVRIALDAETDLFAHPYFIALKRFPSSTVNPASGNNKPSSEEQVGICVSGHSFCVVWRVRSICAPWLFLPLFSSSHPPRGERSITVTRRDRFSRNRTASSYVICIIRLILLSRNPRKKSRPVVTARALRRRKKRCFIRVQLSPRRRRARCKVSIRVLVDRRSLVRFT